MAVSACLFALPSNHAFSAKRCLFQLRFPGFPTQSLRLSLPHFLISQSRITLGLIVIMESLHLSLVEIQISGAALELQLRDFNCREL
jgi:hypothetical protein